MADCISPMDNKYITREGLIYAYEKLCQLFDWHTMPATFAFVMGFILDEDGRRQFRDFFCDDIIEGENWLRNFRTCQSRGDLDGWFCPEALDIVKRYNIHEIAAHGFSHVPLSEHTTSRAIVERELTACTKVANHFDLDLKTFVYPRNAIGHTAALSDAGFAGYREAPRRSFPLVPKKFASLLTEVNPRSKAETYQTNPSDDISRIPGGEMINWQHGARKAIPTMASKVHWGSILADAAKNGKVAHLWLHPHNILTAPATFDLLSDILREVSYWRSENMLEVVTQAQLIGADPKPVSNDIFANFVVKPH